MDWMDKLMDFWRGYSDKDLASAILKMNAHEVKPGSITPVTNREMRAIVKHNIQLGSNHTHLKGK